MSKGAKNIDIVVLEEQEEFGGLEPQIKQVSAKNPLQAYKSAVKSFCPPETGGSNILKKEADLTKNVLPMLYKAFTFKANPDEFHGNALGFVMSQTPELATLTLRKYKDFPYFVKSFSVDEEDLGSEVIWRILSNIQGNIAEKIYTGARPPEDFLKKETEEFMRELEREIIKDVGEKRYTALVKSTQSLIKSIVFYFRFINQPQLLVCDDGDYVNLISKFIGDGIDGRHMDEDGSPRVDKSGMFRTVEPYGLLPVPVYSRSVFKAQPEKEERFLRVFGVSALRMGFTTIDDMPKLKDQLALVEEPLAKAVEKVLEQREDEIALLDADVYDDEDWLGVIAFTDDAMEKYSKYKGDPDGFNQDLEAAEEEEDLEQIGLSKTTLRRFVKNGWTPKTRIGYNKQRWENEGVFRWSVPINYDRESLQQQTIDKLIAIRNLTEKYDDNEELRAQVKELEKERDELLKGDVAVLKKERVREIEEAEKEERRLKDRVNTLLSELAESRAINKRYEEFGAGGQEEGTLGAIYFGGKEYQPEELYRKFQELESENAELREDKRIPIWNPVPGAYYDTTDDEVEKATNTLRYLRDNKKVLRKKRKKEAEKDDDPYEELIDQEITIAKLRFELAEKSRGSYIGDYLRRKYEGEEEEEGETREADKDAREGLEKDLANAEKEVRELTEQVEELETKGNDYDILEAVLERLGVRVEKVIEEAAEDGVESFMNSEKFSEIVEVPIERNLF